MTRSAYVKLLLETSMAEYHLANHVEAALEAKEWARRKGRMLARSYGEKARDELAKYRAEKVLANANSKG